MCVSLMHCTETLAVDAVFNCTGHHVNTQIYQGVYIVAFVRICVLCLRLLARVCTLWRLLCILAFAHISLFAFPRSEGSELDP